MRTESDRIHTGELYYANDPEILAGQLAAQDIMYEFNHTRPSDIMRREELVHQMLGTCGEGVWLEPPFFANFGGKNCHFGDRVYANFGLTCVDDTGIYVGEDTMFGPHVTLATANHPLLAELRPSGLQYNLPIRIGKRCWFGAGAIVVPGVTIGDDTTVAAGCVVTRDLPAGVLAAGVPARVLRDIGERDQLYYYRDREIPWEELGGRGPQGAGSPVPGDPD